MERTHLRRYGFTRRGGALTVTWGNIAVGASVAALLASGPRLLGPEAFGGIALAWTVVTVFGYGVAAPTEQLLSRATSAGEHQGNRQPERRMWLAAASAIAFSLALGHTSDAAAAYTQFTPAAVLGITGWVAAVDVRARLAGHGDLRAYAGVLLGEATLRILLVACALLWSDRAPWILCLAVGFPLLAVGLVRRVLPDDRFPRPCENAASPAEHLAYVGVALGFQACLSGAPILLGLRGAVSESQLGAFVVASSYYRLSAVLVGGLATHSLVLLSHAWGMGDYDRFSASVRRSLWHAAALATLTTAAVLFAAPVLLEPMYGRAAGLPAVVIAGLAVSTVLATVAAVGAVPLMAMSRGVVSASWWLAGAGCLAVTLLCTGELGVLSSIGLMLGPGIAAAGIGWATLTALKAKRPEMSGAGKVA